MIVVVLAISVIPHDFGDHYHYHYIRGPLGVTEQDSENVVTNVTKQSRAEQSRGGVAFSRSWDRLSPIVGKNADILK